MMECKIDIELFEICINSQTFIENLIGIKALKDIASMHHVEINNKI